MIIVEAENGTTTTYNLIVDRSAKDIATIDSLGIDVTPIFNKNNFDYIITTDETSLNLENIVLTDQLIQFLVIVILVMIVHQQ